MFLLQMILTALTCKQSFTQALFNLAAYPEYAAPMREEVLRVLDEEGGWTKLAVNKMVKLDSFLRESSRFQGNDAGSFLNLSSHPNSHSHFVVSHQSW